MSHRVMSEDELLNLIMFTIQEWAQEEVDLNENDEPQLSLIDRISEHTTTLIECIHDFDYKDLIKPIGEHVKCARK